ncbi:MAG: hypothetical protein OEW48_10950 [Phycisphaerae bacterium]|nr:hypothetical protein [Phycisphaerae bacterium]
MLKEDENLGRLNVTKAFQVTKDNNSNYTSLYSFGGRSFSILDPEHVVVGKIYGHTIVFVGIERISGIMVYDVSNPANPVFLDYVNNRNFEEDPESPEAGDLGTECLLFIPANRSPHKCPLVVAAHEIGGTTTVFQVNVTRPLENVDD